MTDACERDRGPTRRVVLGGLTASLAMWGHVPRIAARGADPRLLVIVLRGALDGLATVAPVGDPAFTGLRGELAFATAGAGSGFRLDDFFALNPAMPFLNGLYERRQALFVHAVATPYRGRSHFDGQDVLESGLGGTGAVTDGWLNRAIGVLRSDGRASLQGLAGGSVVPLILRGRAPVVSWFPDASKAPLHVSTAERLADLYGQMDPALATALAKGLEIRRMAAAPTSPAAVARQFQGLITAAEAAARLLRAESGPRIGAFSIGGWDTHANEGVIKGRLNTSLAGLDMALRTLVEDLGPVWQQTTVLLATEFGRTARVNGTSGTDHGTATTAIVLGGSVRGGRVIADWPGLGPNQLFEGRDLKPTTDLRAVAKGLLGEQLGIPARELAATVFPESAGIRALEGLLA
jgi:uncharacterized protein (DUF1501 family)